MYKLVLCVVVVVGCAPRGGGAWPVGGGGSDGTGGEGGGTGGETYQETPYPFWCFEAGSSSACLGEKSECEDARAGHDFETSSCEGASSIWCASFQRADGVVYDDCVLYESECYGIEESVPADLGSSLVEPCFQP